MFAKLLALILVVGVTATVLLVVRQQRLETAHEMSLIHQRLISQERTLWELRAAIGERCRSDDVRRMMDAAALEWDAITGQQAAPPAPLAPVVPPPDDAAPRNAPGPKIAARDGEGLGG